MRLTTILSYLIKNQSFYITTPIFYVNASPHIGHLYSVVIADTIQRFEKLINPSSLVTFSTGTDEHGIKIQRAATKHNKTLEQYCDAISSEYKKLFEDCGIEFTEFIRTTECKHHNAVKHFWNELKKRDCIYLSKYAGWYCVNDETFTTESHLHHEIRDGKKVFLSSESGHPVEWTEEENYMFKLSSLKADLLEWLKKDGTIEPTKFHHILIDYIKDDKLPDISISRPSNRVHWSIKVPDDPSQSVYVWLDALINYLTVVGYPFENNLSNNKWPADIHVVGKDILKFHGIYWPAFLLAVGLDPPKKILCHSHWTVDAKKMSKSLNNVVNPYNTASTLEALRYFLLREGTMHSDANYSEIKMSRILNSELADTLGNLLNRCTSIQLNPKQEFPLLHFNEFRKIQGNKIANNLISHINSLPATCHEHYKKFNFYKVVDAVIAALHSSNEFFNEFKPWILKKSPELQKDLDVILHITLESIRISAIILSPIIPCMSTHLLNKLSIPVNCRQWKDAEAISWQNHESIEIHSLCTNKSIFFQKILVEKVNKQNISNKS